LDNDKQTKDLKMNLKLGKRIISLLYPLLGSFLISCASGPLTTEIDTTKNKVVSTPAEFQSPLGAIDRFSKKLALRKDNQELKALAQDAIESLVSQQNAVARELATTNQLLLMPGLSYEFDLESFCVQTGIERPVTGDGLFLGDISGAPKSWLQQILSEYKTKRISQTDVQALIWSLLAGLKFDELTTENRNNLVKVFPNAALKFGNSQIQDSAKSLVLSQVPNELMSAKDKIDEYRTLLKSAQTNFSELEKVLSPVSDRRTAIPTGWLKHEDGYFIQLKSDGYQQVHVQIYAPANIKVGTYFNPTKHIALPGKGQRLALSGNVITDEYDKSNQGFKNKTGKSLAEAAFITKHPMDAFAIYQSAQKALNLTWDNFKSSHNFQDDRADAFRHFVWSALVVREIGAEKAKEFLDAHEEFPENKEAAKQMDLYNNSKGIQYGENYQGSDMESDVVREGLKRVENGDLRWLK
jgi:hypothetical protein